MCTCVIAGSSAVVNACMCHVLALQTLFVLIITADTGEMVTFNSSPHARAVVTIYYIAMYIMYTATVHALLTQASYLSILHTVCMHVHWSFAVGIPPVLVTFCSSIILVITKYYNVFSL